MLKTVQNTTGCTRTTITNSAELDLIQDLYTCPSRGKGMGLPCHQKSVGGPEPPFHQAVVPIGGPCARPIKGKIYIYQLFQSCNFQHLYLLWRFRTELNQTFEVLHLWAIKSRVSDSIKDLEKLLGSSKDGKFIVVTEVPIALTVHTRPGEICIP